jgi:hypothetical protein
MKPKNKIQSDPVQSFYDQITVALSTTNFVLGFMGIGFVIILLFGALTFSITFGLLFGFILLAVTFNPPYRLLCKMFHFQDLPPHLIKLPIRRIAFNCVSLVMPVFFILIGVRGLQNIGFCSQALICTFSRLLAP